MTDLILGALILAPAALTLILKSNAALGFLALCSGFVLSTSAVGGLKQLLNEMDLSVTETTLALIFISLPLLVTLLLVRSGAKQGLQFVLQLITALAAGGLLALAVAPLLGNSAEFDLEKSKIWENMQNVQAGIIGAGALLSLVLVWAGNLTRPHRKKKH